MLKLCGALIAQLLLCQMVIYAGVGADKMHNAGHNRQRRTLPLTFQRPSVVKFICSLGTPVEELEYETVVGGPYLVAMYALPTNEADLQTLATQDINAPPFVRPARRERRARNFFNGTSPILAKYRWLIYSAIEQWAERLGHDGRACLLKTVCEASQLPFHADGDILNELLHIMLTPSTSADDLGVSGAEHYLEAEHLGRLKGHNCSQLYSVCSISFLDTISNVFEF